MIWRLDRPVARPEARHELDGHLTVVSAWHLGDEYEDTEIACMEMGNALHYCHFPLVYHCQPAVATDIDQRLHSTHQSFSTFTRNRYTEIWTWRDVFEVRSSEQRARFGRTKQFWTRQAAHRDAKHTEGGTNQHYISVWNSKVPSIAHTLGHQSSGAVFWLDADFSPDFKAQELEYNWRSVTHQAGHEDLIVLITMACFAGKDHPSPGLWFTGSCCMCAWLDCADWYSRRQCQRNARLRSRSRDAHCKAQK